ncbi:MAG: hypothetical protein K2P79_11150 [Sphingomonas sp.]|nr:hypothetical protein [Sphingomonas sp.]
MRILLTASLLALAATGAIAGDTDADRATRNAARLDKALAGLTPSAPVACIPIANRRYITQAIGDTILYRANSKLTYRNDTSGGCFGAERGDALISQTPDTQLCRGQIMRSVDLRARTDSGSCALGAFVPYRK